MLAPAEVSKEDNSVVSKGVKETGIVVCPQGLMVSFESTVPDPTETDGLAFWASEVLGAVICGVDGSIVVLCRLSGLATWTQHAPKRRRRCKAISRGTGRSRSWDLESIGRKLKAQGSCSLPSFLPSLDRKSVV